VERLSKESKEIYDGLHRYSSAASDFGTDLCNRSMFWWNAPSRMEPN